MGDADRVDTRPRATGDPQAEVDWADAYVRALALAQRFMREQDQEDVVTEGLTRTLDGRSPWDPGSGRSPAEHVFRVGRDALRAQYRKDKRHGSEQFEAEAVRALEPAAAPTPEQAMTEAELRQRKAELLDRVTTEFAEDPDALAVIDCVRRTILQPEEQAAVTGRSYDAIRDATRRVARRVEALRSALKFEVGDE